MDIAFASSFGSWAGGFHVRIREAATENVLLWGGEKKLLTLSFCQKAQK